MEISSTGGEWNWQHWHMLYLVPLPGLDSFTQINLDSTSYIDGGGRSHSGLWLGLLPGYGGKHPLTPSHLLNSPITHFSTAVSVQRNLVRIGVSVSLKIYQLKG